MLSPTSYYYGSYVGLGGLTVAHCLHDYIFLVLLKKQAQGCIVDMIIPTNLVCILFSPPIPTSPFNFIVFYTCFCSFLFLFSVIYPRRKAQAEGYCNRLANFVRPSVRLFVRPYGKGRLRESTHLRITRHQGRVVTLSPAQWYNSVQLWLPFCTLLVSCQCSDSVNRQRLSSA